eukprot:CAMPEP_0182459100 /NCGR_PEP_ID=MMETSP1319-20130603/4299_1 /TAXON_ID=172717 /ORGANISM="Bolidomonas pacifica, Strain RCC208" /LENGTH=54 /DNA_ID=CAMNT_0024657937 /DNA_START=299 /DNA_END=460 /DNA_ORIENTATION=+
MPAGGELAAKLLRARQRSAEFDSVPPSSALSSSSSKSAGSGVSAVGVGGVPPPS